MHLDHSQCCLSSAVNPTNCSVFVPVLCVGVMFQICHCWGLQAGLENDGQYFICMYSKIYIWNTKYYFVLCILQSLANYNLSLVFVQVSLFIRPLISHITYCSSGMSPNPNFYVHKMQMSDRMAPSALLWICANLWSWVMQSK